MSIVSRIAHSSAHAEATAASPGGKPWWETLSPDFPFRQEPFALGAVDRVRVGLTAASDVLLRTLGACIAGPLAFPLGYHPAKFRDALRARDLYVPIARSGDPTKFLTRPPRGVRISSHPGRHPLFRPDDGDCTDLYFESPYVPFDPAQRRDYLRHEKNRIAHARFWKHHGPTSRPTIIAVHGFSADLYHLNEWFFALPWFYKMGCDVLLFTLPFHGKRQTRFSPFSGHGFFAGGAARINEAFAQGVHDLRVLVDWLEERGVSDIGLTGVSLGGFTSALAATAEPRLKFVIPNVPVVSIADLVLEWHPIAEAVRLSLAAAGRTLVDARELLAVSSPLSYPSLVPRERLMIVGGVGDRLAPPKHARLLWDHWNRPRMHWFPGSHLVHLDRGEYLRQVARFLGEIGFLPQRSTKAA